MVTGSTHPVTGKHNKCCEPKECRDDLQRKPNAATECPTYHSHAGFLLQTLAAVVGDDFTTASNHPHGLPKAKMREEKVSLVTFIDDINIPTQDMDAQLANSQQRHSLCTFDHVPSSYSYIIDSGATIHVVSDASVLTRITNRSPRTSLRVANGVKVQTQAIGEVDLELEDQYGAMRTITLYNVHFAPGIDSNIISVRRLWKDTKIKTKFGDTDYFKTLDGSRFHFTHVDGEHYRLLHGSTTENARVFALSNEILHSRLGHCGEKRARLARDRSVGLDTELALFQQPKQCPACLQGAARLPIRKQDRAAAVEAQQIQFGDVVNSDLLGPLPASVNGGYTYAICFVDKATRTADIAFLKSKHADNVLEALKQFQNRHKDLLPNGRVKEWRTDAGGEFTSHNLDDFCEELAIKRSFSIPYEPRKGNARAERFWGMVLRPMRSMLAESKLPLKFWTYAMQQAALLHDVLPTRALPDSISPFEARTNTKPNLSRIRPFGCQCFVHLHKRDRPSKLSPTYVEAIHLGQDGSHPGYTVYIPSLERYTSAWHVRFREHVFVGERVSGRGTTYVHDNDRQRNTVRFRADLQGAADPAGGGDANGRTNEPYFHGDETHWAENHCSHPDCTLGKHPDSVPHSFERFGNAEGPPAMRTRRAQLEGALAVFAACAQGASMPYLFNLGENCLVPEPKSYEEALGSSLAHKWQEAMDKEISELMSHGTWSLVRRDAIPKGRKPCRSKWVYKTKTLADGTVERYKARLVVCGYSQREGIDYDRAFSSTLRATSFRTLLAIAAAHGLQLRQVDVSNAFVQAELDGVDLFVDMAKGFEEFDKDGEPFVLKLQRALYGAKQSSRLWQLTLRKFLVEELHFVNSVCDPCLYALHTKRGIILLGVYVDDIVCAVSNDHIFDYFWTRFNKRFRSKYLGKLEWFLSMSVTQTKESVHVNQSKYICDMVDKFLPDAKNLTILRDTPAVVETFSKLKGAESDEERARMRERPYLQLVGSLLYVSTMSRCDISYHLSVLCRFMGDPSEQCYSCALQVLGYLYKTRDLGLRYEKQAQIPTCMDSWANEIRSNMGFHTFSDSSWGVPNPAYGYISFMAGGPISFVAKNLKSAGSSCEAEYSAAAYAARDVTFIRSICRDLGYPLRNKLVLGVDNTAAIDVANNLGVTGRNKHYELEIHYIREQVSFQRTHLIWIPTKYQTADLFTKTLDKTTFLRHRDTCLH